MNTSHSTHVSHSDVFKLRDGGRFVAFDREDMLILISNDQMVVTQKLKLAFFLPLKFSSGLDDVLWGCKLKCCLRASRMTVFPPGIVWLHLAVCGLGSQGGHA